MPTSLPATNATECAGRARSEGNRPLRRRKRNETAIEFLFGALLASTGRIPNLTFEVACPVDPAHRALLLARHYFATGTLVLHCSDGCPESDLYAALGVSAADLVDRRRIRASNPTARRRIAARRLAEAS